MRGDVVSVGVLPNSTLLDAEDVKKLCYTTTASRAFSDPRLTPNAAPAESFKHLHWIGHRSGKYMQYPQKRAPYFQRTSCHYTMEFGPKPMGDLLSNREIMALNKQSHMDGPKSLGAKMDTTSHYTDDFRQFTREEVQKARPTSAKPAQARWKSLGKLGETKSMAHEHFGELKVQFDRGEVLKPESTLGKIKPGWAMYPALPRTHYTEEFNHHNTVYAKQKARRSSAPPGGRRPIEVAIEQSRVNPPEVRGEESMGRRKRPTSAAAISTKIGSPQEAEDLAQAQQLRSRALAARPGTAPAGSQRRQRPQSAVGTTVSKVSRS
mmetsp:Transcript_50222/g.92782  ORF Transcript_50222/g.92782 Transcript_50222/m.92782 type:complete len:322 (-) Transcript_50222:85-1050(-)